MGKCIHVLCGTLAFLSTYLRGCKQTSHEQWCAVIGINQELKIEENGQDKDSAKHRIKMAHVSVVGVL